MKISQTFKIAVLTIATAFAGYAAADSRADRQNEAVSDRDWDYIENLPAPAAGNKAEAKGSAGKMDHGGMMMSKEDCMKMHEKMMDGMGEE